MDNSRRIGEHGNGNAIGIETRSGVRADGEVRTGGLKMDGDTGLTVDEMRIREEAGTVALENTDEGKLQRDSEKTGSPG
jgi:hypothetical protein